MVIRNGLILLLLGLGTLASLPLSADDLKFYTDRIVPHLKQHWYFSIPYDVAFNPNDELIYVANTQKYQIQVFTESGELVRSWGSQGSGEGQFRPAALTIGPDGRVHVVDDENNRIQVFTSDGQFITQWGSQGLAPGQFLQATGITVSESGQVYVTDEGNNRIQIFTTSGQLITTFGRGGSENGEFVYPWNIKISPTSGLLFVTDAGNGRIQVFNPEGQILYSWGKAGAYGVGELLYPKGIAFDNQGLIYITDDRNHRIQVYKEDGEYVNTIGIYGKNDGEFNHPGSIAINSTGKLYIADTGNNRIQILDREGDFIQTWSSQSAKTGWFQEPRALAIHNDRLYVADTGNDRVQVFSADGQFLDDWGSSGSDSGQFDTPLAIAVHPSGRIYVLDNGNNRIQLFNSQGAFLGRWGEYGTSLPTTEDTIPKFNNPQGIAIDANGHIYVADSGNHRIQVFDQNGIFLRAWGNEGTEKGQFFGPVSLAFDSQGLLYIVDTGNHRIQVFNTEGQFQYAWGQEGTAEGQFLYPRSLVIDSNNHLYIADADRNDIQIFTSQGEYLSRLGQAGTQSGQFAEPFGLAINNKLYVADSLNHRIQVFSNQPPTPSPPSNASVLHKAIIVAGGGPIIGGFPNHIWDSTQQLANKAYNALRGQGFNENEVKYLTASPTLQNNFETASLANLQQAITEWAKDAEQVVIYLIDHGGPLQFQMNDTEILTADQLKDWITPLENVIPGHVTVIIEACKSGSFIDRLSSPGRFLITSSDKDQRAVVSNHELTSFSFYFWSAIHDGAILQEAFKTAAQGISSTLIDQMPQKALLDTDGDFEYQLADRTSLGDYCIGNCITYAATPPAITRSTAHTTLEGNTRLPLAISVNSVEPLVSAWGIVQRPDDPSIEDDQPLDFDKVILTCNVQNQCEGTYERFDVIGDYQISFFAQNQISQMTLPLTTTITQTQGRTVPTVEYKEQTGTVYLRDVLVDGAHYQAALQLKNGQFTVTALKTTSPLATPAQFNSNSGLLKIPEAWVFGTSYQAEFQYLGDLMFQLNEANPLDNKP